MVDYTEYEPMNDPRISPYKACGMLVCLTSAAIALAGILWLCGVIWRML
jgi:hypothetical protein